MKRSNSEEDLRPSKKPKLDNQPTPIFDLSYFPPELIEQILHFVPESHFQRHLRLVCTQWFNIINYSQFTISSIARTDVPQVIDCFSRYTRPIGLKVRFERRNFADISPFMVLTNLTSLDFGYLLPSNYQDLTNMTKLNFFSVDKADINIINKMTNLTRLKTTGLDLDHNKIPKPLPLLTLPNLERLDTIGMEYKSVLPKLTRITALAFEIPLPRNIPNVRYIKALESGQWDADPELPYYYSNLETLVTDVSFTNLPVDTLTKLCVRLGATNTTQQIVSTLTNLKSLKITGPKAKFLCLTTLVNLEKCCLALPNRNFSGFVGQLDPLKITSLENTFNSQKEFKQLSKFTNLRVLKVKYTRAIDCTSVKMLTNLTKLKIEPYSNPKALVNLSPSLTRMVQLKSLTIKSPCVIEDSLVLTHLTNLEQISLDTARHYNFRGLTKINYLTLSSGSYDKKVTNFSWEGISGSLGLTRLEVDMCTDDQWNEILQLTSLDHLHADIGGDESRIDQLTVLRRLTWLQATQKCQVTGEGLTNLTRLHLLQFTSTKCTPQTMNDVRTKLKFSTEINFDWFR